MNEPDKRTEQDQKEFDQKLAGLMRGIMSLTGMRGESTEVQDVMRNKLSAALSLNGTLTSLSIPGSKQLKSVSHKLNASIASLSWLPYALLGWVFISEIGKLASGSDAAETALGWMDEWRLTRAVEETMSSSGCTPEEIQNAIQAIRIGVHHQGWYKDSGSESEKQLLRKWLSDSEIQNFLKVNRHNSILWYNRESFGEFLTWMQVIALVETQKESLASSTVAETLLGSSELMKKIKVLDKKSAYQVLKLIG